VCSVGERPYHCGACGQRYTQGHLLKAHIRSRHGAEMAYYNMDKRSDGVRCRRSLSAANRLDPASTAGLINPGLKEDKIRFLLEAAEAARGVGSSAPRAAVPPAPAGPFAGMSLGQYVNALSSCLPGTAGIRPLLWNPTQPFQPLPHDGVTSHAALLSSLAAAPMPSVQNITSTPAQGVPDRSILNSLLASYATGSPLFSINGLSGSVPGTAEAVGTSPIRCPSSEAPAVPQDLSMSAARDGSDSRRTGSESTPDTDFLSATTAGSLSTHLGSGHQSTDIPNGSPVPLPPHVNQPTNFRASNGSTHWPDGPRAFGGTSAVKMEEEEATDLSVRNIEASERSYRKSPTVPDDVVGTVDLSARTTDRKPELANLQTHSGAYRLVGKTGCCGEDSTCPHLKKLKELRRNVYRMLSVFTPYLDVAGAGIADVEADAVDDFLHEVIYSSQLDQATD